MSDANVIELLLTLNLAALALVYRRLSKKTQPPPLDLLGRFNHDLRSPLTGILGFAELLERQPLTEKQKIYTERIHECSMDMMNLLRDVTELSHLECKKPFSRATQFSLHQTVQSAMKEHKSLARLKGVKLQEHVEKGLLVWADAGSIKRCISRLLENAIKASPQNGEVILTANTQEGGVCLTVSDQGAGIKLEDAANLFRLFSLQPSPDGHKGRQTQGLALYLIQRIAALQNLRIWGENAQGPEQGARFHLWVPSTEPAQ